MKSFRIGAAIVALILPLQSVAAAEQSCLTPPEAQALITSFLPDLILATRDGCRASLPADAFLVRSGEALAARYDGEAGRAWTAARPAMGKLIGEDAKLFDKLDDQTTRKVIGAGVAAKMGGSVKAKDCETVSQVLEALEPLPPANMSRLLGIVFEAVGRAKKQSSTGFTVCPPPAQAVR
ncbi:hypothetical protein ACFSCW_08925 [Sphingomonas tabacisoli]|uniref:Uncharacterized protein n=1 Tax=Sphingomonas tabacisoli TaxID=2249466 RepID=A0ABW4I303_9SPHN